MDTEYNPHKTAADALIDEIDDMDMPALIKSVPDLYEYIPDLNSVELAQVKAAFLTRAEKIGDKKLIQSIMSSGEKKIKKAERSDTIRYNREVQPAFLEFTDKGAPKESINNFLQIMLCQKILNCFWQQITCSYKFQIIIQNCLYMVCCNTSTSYQCIFHTISFSFDTLFLLLQLFFQQNAHRQTAGIFYPQFEYDSIFLLFLLHLATTVHFDYPP